MGVGEAKLSLAARPGHFLCWCKESDPQSAGMWKLLLTCQQSSLHQNGWRHRPQFWRSHSFTSLAVAPFGFTRFTSTGLPVFAAGGIGDGRGVAAVLALGAAAAAIGTSFLLATESGITPAYREALASPQAVRTVFTRAFSGRTARGIPNRVIADLNDPGDIAPYPFQNAMTRDIRTAAAEQGRAEFLSLWAGQAAALATAKPAAEIVADLVREARESLAGAGRSVDAYAVTMWA